jgi:hypothetical protein
VWQQPDEKGLFPLRESNYDSFVNSLYRLRYKETIKSRYLPINFLNCGNEILTFVKHTWCIINPQCSTDTNRSFCGDRMQ